MMAKTVEKHGSFSCTELMTTGVVAAKDFCEQLFEWEFRRQNPSDTSHCVIKRNAQNKPVVGEGERE